MNVQLVSRLNDDLTLQLYEMYKNEWWSKDRKYEDVRYMLENSDYIFALVDETDGRLLAFARVISDRIYKAIILDVIVRKSVRSRKYGRQIMDAIMYHPDISRIRHIELYCLPAMDTFYEMWGFTTDVGGAHLMRKYNDS